MPDETSVVGSGEENSEPTPSLLTSADGATPQDVPTPVGETNPYHSIFADDSGNFADSWQEHLKGDEYADLRATAANYKSLPQLLKGLKESKSAAMSRNEGMIKLPGEDASDEDRAAFNAAIGVPDSAEGYTTEGIDGLPEDFEVDGETAKALHSLGVSQSQFAGLLQIEQQMEQAREISEQQAQKEWHEDQRKELQTEFGSKFQEKTTLANRAAQTFGLDPNDPMFGSAQMVKVFANIGAAISEDKLVTSESVTNSLTPESAADDIIMNESNADYKAYHDPDHPRHGEVNKKVDMLLARAFPEN